MYFKSTYNKGQKYLKQKLKDLLVKKMGLEHANMKNVEQLNGFLQKTSQNQLKAIATLHNTKNSNDNENNHLSRYL